MRAGARHGPGLGELHTLVHQQGGVAAVVKDHVGVGLAPVQDLFSTPPVVDQRFAFPGEDGHASRVVRGAIRADHDGGRCFVLGGEDVARGPAHLGTQLHESLDEDCGLHCHVQRPGDARTVQRLAFPVTLTQCHQSRHLMLRQRDLFPPGGAQRKVCNPIFHPVILPSPRARPIRSQAPTQGGASDRKGIARRGVAADRITA